MNLHLFFASTGAVTRLEDELSELVAERTQLERQLRDHVNVLSEVRWKGLGNEVESANRVLALHAFSWGRLLTELELTLPYAVRLVQVQPSVDEHTVDLRIDAVAQTREAMLEFFANLIASPAFDRPVPRREIQEAGYEFSLKVTYVPEVGEAEPLVEVAAEPDSGGCDRGEPNGGSLRFPTRSLRGRVAVPLQRRGEP